MIIGFRLDDYAETGMQIPVKINLSKQTSHVLIAGKSGSGKSLSTKFYIYCMLRSRESLVFIADYKGGEEYEALEGLASYASGDSAIQMIEKFYDFFIEIRNRKIRLKRHFTLVIEEWFGLLTYAETQSKGLKNSLLSKVAEILSVGRGLNIGIFIVVQRADASNFASGSREQFQCVLSFGRTSPEQFKMLGFSGELEDNPTQNFKAGQALALVDGQDGVTEIIVPLIRNPDTLTRAIKSLMKRQPDITAVIDALPKA